MKYRTCFHLAHLLISIFFWPYALVWFCLAISAARHNRAVNAGIQKEMLGELKKLNKGAQ